MMRYETIEQIYEANRAIRAKLRETLTRLTDAEASHLPAGEKWNIAQIAEHVSMVNGGIAKICARLLSKAEAAGRTNDGRCHISEEFLARGIEAGTAKLEAPEMVQPVHGLSLAESLGRLDEAYEALESIREKFESFDGTDPKFPHPYFGDLTAQEWLVMAGAHEARHLSQIRRVAEEVRSAEAATS